MNRYIAVCRIVETGSFSKTANEMGYSQSAVSQMIRSLENEFSMPLLIRSRGTVELTPEGRELMPYIRSVVNSYRSLEEKVRTLRGIDSGEVRIGTIASVSQEWLPKMIKSFKSVYPKSSFSLRQGDYTSISQWVRSGEVDFGFVNSDAVAGLKTVPLFVDEMMVVLPACHPLAEKTSVPLECLAGESYIQLDEGSFSEPINAFLRCGLEPVTKLCVYDDYTVMAMVEEGLGYSIIPESNLAHQDYNIAIRSAEPRITRNMCMIYENINSIPQMSRLFIDFFIKRVKEVQE